MKFPDDYACESSESFYRRAFATALKIAGPVDVIYKTVMCVFAVVLILFLAWLALLGIDRQPPSDVTGVRLLTPKVSPGSRIAVAFSIVRHRICQVDVASEALDAENAIRGVSTQHKDASGPLGPDYFVRRFPVDSDAALGRGRLRVSLSWQCPGNPIQAIDPIVRVFQFDINIVATPRSLP